MPKYHQKNWEKNVLPSIKQICVECSKSCKGKYPVTGCGSFNKKVK